jgi:hypothetical protein
LRGAAFFAFDDGLFTSGEGGLALVELGRSVVEEMTAKQGRRYVRSASAQSVQR